MTKDEWKEARVKSHKGTKLVTKDGKEILVLKSATHYNIYKGEVVKYKSQVINGIEFAVKIKTHHD